MERPCGAAKTTWIGSILLDGGRLLSDGFKFPTANNFPSLWKRQEVSNRIWVGENLQVCSRYRHALGEICSDPQVPDAPDEGPQPILRHYEKLLQPPNNLILLLCSERLNRAKFGGGTSGRTSEVGASRAVRSYFRIPRS